MPPQVGIFWLLPDRRVLIDATPLDQAERHDRYLIHAPSHIDVWERWRLEGIVPAERASLLADRRILGDQAVLKEIMERMGLPKDTVIGTDPHYRTDQTRDEDD